MSDQIFEVADIPLSLWDPTYEHGREKISKGKLRLPAQLERAYRQILDELNLTAKASNIDDREDGPIGDEGEDGAHDHFAKRFSGSCGRIQLFALDPHHTFKTTRQALAMLFSGGRVRLLDIPLGAGAAALELLCLVGQLRSEEPAVFPRIDLDIEIVGGEINPHAIGLSKRLYEIIRPWWLEQGINVSWQAVTWDVMNDESTDELVDIWKHGIDKTTAPAVVGANFSGFLGALVEGGSARRHIDEAESCLRHIFASASRLGATVYTTLLLVGVNVKVKLTKFLSLAPRIQAVAGERNAAAWAGMPISFYREFYALCGGKTLKDHQIIIRTPADPDENWEVFADELLGPDPS